MLAHSPSIVTSGLSLLVDAANPRSYSPNVFPNPLSVGSWVPSGYQMSISSDYSLTSPAGGVPLKIVTSGSSAYTSTYNNSNWNLAPAASGQTWTFSFWVKGSSSFSASCLIFEANSSGGYITYGQPYYNVTTEWTRVTGSYTMTNGSTNYVQFRIDNYNSGVTMWVDGLQLERSSSATAFNSKPNINGTSWVDLSGNANTLTLQNINSFTYNSGGFSFDGSYSYMQCPTSCGITGSVTLSAWIKPNRSGQTGPHSTVICTDVGYPAGAKLMNYKNTSRYGLWLGWGGTTSYEAFIGVDINDNTNKMLTASWEQATGVVKIYLNGVVQSTISTGITTPVSLYDGKITVGTDYNNIGSGSYNKYLGNVYNASVYNRALSDAEVAQNFNAMRGRFGV